MKTNIPLVRRIASFIANYEGNCSTIKDGYSLHHLSKFVLNRNKNMTENALNLGQKHKKLRRGMLIAEIQEHRYRVVYYLVACGALNYIHLVRPLKIA